jgi:hypothetical protein
VRNGGRKAFEVDPELRSALDEDIFKLSVRHSVNFKLGSASRRRWIESD